MANEPRTTDLVNLYHATPVKGPVDFGIGELGSHFADNPDLSRRAMKLLGHKDYRILEAKVNLGNVVTVPEQESFFGAEDLVTNLLDQGSITSEQASEFFDSIDRVQAGDHPAVDRAWEALEKAGIYGGDALDKQAETEFLRPLLKKWGIDTIRYWNTYDAHGELGRFKDLESVAKELELGTQPSWSYIVVDPERVDSSKEHKPGVPAVIDAASAASQLARFGADDSRPKGLRGGLGSLKRAPWFALAQMFWENLTPKQREVAEQYGKDAYGSFEDAWKAASAWSRRNRFPTGVEGGLQWAMDLLGFSDSEPEEDSRLKAFQRLASQQRGDPETAMKDAQETMGGGVLFKAIEYTGDLTNRMADKYDFFGGYGYDVGNKIRTVLQSLRSEYGFGKQYRESIRNEALYRGISEKEQQDASTKALQKYADAHKKLKVFNEPQKWARDAAVALGEQRFGDAENLLSKLENLIQTDPDSLLRDLPSGRDMSEAYREAAGRFDPDFEGEQPKKLLIMGCSAGKNPVECAVEASKLYKGGLWNVLNKNLGGADKVPEAIGGAGIDLHILSAKHGLIPADELIENYDQLLTKGRASEILGDKKMTQNISDVLGRYEPENVFVAAGKDYRELIKKTMNREYPTFQGARGIGDQRKQLKEWLARNVRPRSTDLERKAAGGFVDRPLYEDARMIG